MCGIAGWIDYKQNIGENRLIFEKMSKTLENRGPDEGAIYAEDHAALIHRRLCVIDIENGKQPMTRTVNGNTYTLVYNGELYNAPDIREELLLFGYQFTGHSDTEVLLYSYIQWKDDCVDKLNGIYAFAVWDHTAKNLYMARDRMGVKPFFYHRYNGGLIFGSEIKTLLAHPNIRHDVDTDGVLDIMLIGPGRTPGSTPFKAISELRRGFCSNLNKDGLQLRQYWNIEARPHTDNLADTIEHTRELVVDAIRRQLVSDVPLCTLLSGGLDSSIISSLAAQKLAEEGKVLDTFSVNYTDNDKHFTKSKFQPDSDDEWIVKMCTAIGSNHRDNYLENMDLADALYDSTLARDLPGMADVDSSLILFLKFIKQHATVALSGECADEIFGGYPWYHNPEILYRHSFPWTNSIENRCNLLRDGLVTRTKAADYVFDRYSQTIKSASKNPDDSHLESRMKEMFMLNMDWFMQTLLDRKDRMSMAHGLEVRVPFCDHRIVEYLYNVPWSMKALQDREKGLLRAAMNGLLPDDVLWRKKSPYPKTHNPEYLSAVKQKLEPVVKKPSSPIFEIISKKALTELLESGTNNLDAPWYGQLMTYPQTLAYLLQLNYWMTSYDVNII